MINDLTAASDDRAETADPLLIATVNPLRQRLHRPTVIDDAPQDWEWEDWAARFWAGEPHALADDDASSNGR